MVGPTSKPRSSNRTPLGSRATPSPHRRAVSSTNTAASASSPLTEGIATRSRSSSTSPGKIHPQIGGLLCPAYDACAPPGTDEDLQQKGIGSTPVDDVGALDTTGGGADAGLDLGTHATRQRSIGCEPGYL